MSETKIYQGELTLIRIKDGADGGGIRKVYEFYCLGGTKSDKQPAIPPVPNAVREDGTIFPIEQITQSPYPWENKINDDWNWGADYPYIWNFKRTEYDNGIVEHSEPVIASFWSSSPRVMAVYSADQKWPWAENYDEKKHNYIAMSYDGGATWTPPLPGTSGEVPLEEFQGGIRIKGRVEVDEAAITYNLAPSQNEILFYLDDYKQIQIAPKDLTIEVQKQYLGTTEVVDLVKYKENSNKETQKFVPELSCELLNYSTLNQSQPLNFIFRDYPELIEFDYTDVNELTGTSLIYFHFEDFYNILIQKALEEMQSTTGKNDYSKIKNTLEGMESLLSFTLYLRAYNEEENLTALNTLYFKCPVRYATSYDLANFSVHANGITQSIRSTLLHFDVDGLTVENGGLKIMRTLYESVGVIDEDRFLSGEFYVQTGDGTYARAVDYSELIEYFEKKKDEALKADKYGNLYIDGVGSFKGAIYAEKGIFNGEIRATSGYLENLFVTGELSIQDSNQEAAGLKIRGEYTPATEIIENATYYKWDEEKRKFVETYFSPDEGQSIKLYVKTERPGIESTNFDLKYGDNGTYTFSKGFYLDPIKGKIWAGSMELSSETIIHDKILFGHDGFSYGSICNPDKYDGAFINAYEEKSDGKGGFIDKPLLKIKTDGTMYLGPWADTEKKNEALIFDGRDGSIQSGNYLPGSRGWRIDGINAEFNNIIARGTLKTAIFEYDKISAIGGMVLVRPSALIAEANYVEKEDGEYDFTLVQLVLDTNYITFRPRETDPETGIEITPSGDYYFRIVENGETIGSTGGVSTTGLGGNEAYVLVSESEITDKNKYKTVIIKKPLLEDEPIDSSRLWFSQEDLTRFTNSLLLGYGTENDIGIGLNSQSSSTALPPQAISVFQTYTEVNPKWQNGDNKPNGRVELRENPRIILGKIDNNLANTLDLEGGYGLYADNVNVKGELSSSTNKWYSGINSNSKVYWKQWINEAGEEQKDEDTKIILWAGADIYGKEKEKYPEAIRNAPFRVDLAGRVFASQGEFSGKITGSDIYASTLHATTIIGYDGLNEKGAAALTIRDANVGLRFVGRSGAIHDPEYGEFGFDDLRDHIFFELNENGMFSDVLFEAKKGISTPTLTITKNLSIGESKVRIGPGETNKEHLAFLYKNDWNFESLPAEEVAYLADDGLYIQKETHLDGEIYFGDQTMEYKKAYYNETKTLIGYDLYIKS